MISAVHTDRQIFKQVFCPFILVYPFPHLSPVSQLLLLERGESGLEEGEGLVTVLGRIHRRHLQQQRHSRMDRIFLDDSEFCRQHRNHTCKKS